MIVANAQLALVEAPSTPRSTASTAARTSASAAAGCAAESVSRVIDDLLPCRIAWQLDAAAVSDGCGRASVPRRRADAATGCRAANLAQAAALLAAIRPTGVFDSVDEHAAPGVTQRDEPGLRDLLDEVAERARAVVALRERRVELQQRALQQPELRRYLAIRRAP